MSFRGAFNREVQARLAPSFAPTVVTDADLAAVPAPVQRYLQAAGVVGRPRVQNYRVRFRGRIRGEPHSRWMPFVAEQQSFVDPPCRLFLMHARRYGLPVEAFHELVDGRARMRVRLLGAIGIVDASGEVMDRSEAVTLFNDMCVLAPATLVAAPVSWESVDATTVRGTFRNDRQTIAATLHFDDEGRLQNFVSADRSRASADGKVFTRFRFSTPLRNYRAFGSVRLASHGDARWLLPEGEFTYGEFEIESVEYNVVGGGERLLPERPERRRGDCPPLAGA